MPKTESLPYRYKWPRPSVTADCVLFGVDDADLKVLLIQRKHDPFAGKWAFPGGFVNENESILTAACRELQEETGLENVKLEQFAAFGDPGRDPRGWTVTIAHWALVNLDKTKGVAADDAAAVDWFPAADPPPLAFDHEQILAMALQRLRTEISRRPVGLALLPRQFTVLQLQHLYEKLHDRKIDRRAFASAIQKQSLLVPVGRSTPAMYRFDRANYKRLTKQGIDLRF
jgi:8-oxo-dGTP diphosphatase